MQQPLKEQQNYRKKLTVVFPPSDPNEIPDNISVRPGVYVKAIRICKPDGTYLIRLHVENNGTLEPPFEFSLDEMNSKITKLKNYSVPFNGVELMLIIKGVKKFMTLTPIPTLEQFNTVGWQKDNTGNITSWKSATAIDLQGSPLIKDIYAQSPSYDGDLQTNISYLNDYISRHNAVAQSILLYGFSAVLAGYFHKVLLLSLSGKSSRGKTTLSKLLISLYAEPENERLSTTFNVTLNKITERLNGINGVATLIDDLSLAPATVKKNIDSLIYVLESGKEKERMRTKTFDRDPALWSTTIILSTEEPLLSKCNPEKEGTVGRLMEVNISPDDLFSDAEESNVIADLSHKHYGLVADEFVKQLIASNTLSNLSTLYENEKNNLRKKYSGPVARMSENVAYVTLTGKLLNQLLNFQFNIDDVENCLMSAVKDNLENFRIEQKDNVIIKTIYPELIKYAHEVCPDENNALADRGTTDRVVISSKALKDFLTALQKQLNCKPAQVKSVLKDHGVLCVNDGQYGYIATINKKSFRGMCLYVKNENELLAGDEEELPEEELPENA